MPRPEYDYTPGRLDGLPWFAPGTPMRSPATRACPVCGATGGDLCNTTTGTDHPTRI